MHPRPTNCCSVNYAQAGAGVRPRTLLPWKAAPQVFFFVEKIRTPRGGCLRLPKKTNQRLDRQNSLAYAAPSLTPCKVMEYDGGGLEPKAQHRAGGKLQLGAKLHLGAQLQLGAGLIFPPNLPRIFVGPATMPLASDALRVRSYSSCPGPFIKPRAPHSRRDGAPVHQLLTTQTFTWYQHCNSRLGLATTKI